ncbi:hypothetical protein ACI2OX_12980 [Bacillus sp. N9]
MSLKDGHSKEQRDTNDHQHSSNKQKVSGKSCILTKVKRSIIMGSDHIDRNIYFSFIYVKRSNDLRSRSFIFTTKSFERNGGSTTKKPRGICGAFISFLLELKEENEQFLSIIQQLQKQNKDQKKPIAETYKETKDSPQPTMLNQEQPITAETYATLLTYPDENINQSVESDAEAEKAETMQTSLIDQALQLQGAGASIDEIAKNYIKARQKSH